jgi:hypothetical protein
MAIAEGASNFDYTKPHHHALQDACKNQHFFLVYPGVARAKLTITITVFTM